MTSLTAPITPANPRPASFNDIGPVTRGAMLAGGIGLGSIAMIAVVRALAGFAPSSHVAKEVAVMIHLAAVLPAIPLGLYVLMTRKGGARHRMLGKIWMTLMAIGAISALFIRNLNGGSFSWIHIFVPLTLFVGYKAITAARAGRIVEHKRRLTGMFLGALLIPGLFSFLPGRLMAIWLWG